MNRSVLNNSAFLSRITEIIKANLKNEQFGVSLLALEIGMSRSNLHRRIKAETGKSVSQFISQVRLAYALDLLQNSELTVSEAAYESGFHSVTYFSTCFHDYYGYSPGKTTGKAPPQEESVDPAPEMPGKSSRSKKRRVLLSFLIVLSLVFISLFLVVDDRPLPPPENSPVKIAVLPMQSAPADNSGQTLVYAVLFQLIKNLSEIENFEVRLMKTDLQEGQFMSGENEKNENADYIIESKASNRNEIEIKLKNVENSEYEMAESFLTGKDIFYPAARMASKIAASINTNLSDKEKAAFEKMHSVNRSALLNYQLGINYKSISEQGKSSEGQENLLKAKSLFEEAVRLDSSFTEAYIELGHVYIDNLYYMAGTMQQADQYLESGHKLVGKALELEKDNSEALTLLVHYYLRKGMKEQANRIYARLSLNKRAGYHHYINEFDAAVHYEDYYNAVKNFLYYVKNKPVSQLTHKYMLYNVALIFSDTGFPETGREYARKLLTDYNDSLQFYRLMGTLEMRAGNHREAVEWHQKTAGEREFTSGSYHFFKFNYILLGDMVNAGRYLKEWEAAKKDEIRYPSQYYIAGMICRRTGQPDKALAYFKAAEKNLLEALTRNTHRSQIYVEQFYLAGVYFELGETEKAIHYLSMLNERKTIPHWIVSGFEIWPPLTERRNIPEIEDIYQNLLVKFNQEHNRIGKLLVNEGLIEPFAQQTTIPE